MLGALRRSPYWPVVSNPVLRLLLLGFALSYLGDGLALVAIVVLAQQLTPNPVLVGVAVAASRAPSDPDPSEQQPSNAAGPRANRAPFAGQRSFCGAAVARPQDSRRRVPWRGGVLAGLDSADERAELGVAQQVVHERGGAADAGPVVIP